MIREGLEMVEIGNQENVTRERIRQYINSSGQYEVWKKAREKIKQEPKIKNALVGSLVGSLIDSKIEEVEEYEREAYKLAVRYICEHPKSKRPVEQLAELFRRYLWAKDDDCKMSYEQLAEGLPLHATQARGILRDLGLNSLHGSFERNVTSKSNKEAIKRADKAKMSQGDVAYFLGLPLHVVLQNRSRWGMKPFGDHRIASFREGRNYTIMNYRLASQIYEAQDAGFSEDETTELLDASKRAIRYALKNRKGIEKRIISGLKVLFPNRNINKPYLAP